jgi:prepilin-type N-terminal cleavage/methylation domain-containing protein
MTPRPGGLDSPKQALIAARRGFTLIEVIGALVVFSLAVLMATSLTTALAVQMRYSSIRSEIASHAQSRLDSIAILPYDSVDVGSIADTLVIQGSAYRNTLTVLQLDPRIREVQVSLAPVVPPGPQYRVVTYVVAPW